MNALTRDLVKLVETAEQSQKTREELSVSDRKFREKLHLMPPVGWLNDPNGLCQFQGLSGNIRVPHFIQISHLTVTEYIPDPHLLKMEKCICTIQEMSN